MPDNDATVTFAVTTPWTLKAGDVVEIAGRGTLHVVEVGPYNTVRFTRSRWAAWLYQFMRWYDQQKNWNGLYKEEQCPAPKAR